MYINVGLYSKYRSELMGVASLLIIICHMHVFGVIMPNWIAIIIRNAGAGVDVFLFLSGFGLFNSYSKHLQTDNNLVTWYFRKYLRIIVPSTIIIIPVLLIRNLMWGGSINNIWVAVCGFGYLFGRSPLWFIPCIILLYLLTPVFNFVLYKKGKKWIWAIGLSLLCLALAYFPVKGFENIQFIIQRWPSYIIGYTLAKDINDNKKISVLFLIFLPLCMYFLMLICNHYLGSHFCLFWSQGIVIVSICCLIIDKIRSKKIEMILTFMGIISLESYVTNDYVMKTLIFSNCLNFAPGHWSVYLIESLFCVLLSFFVNKLSRILINK